MADPKIITTKARDRRTIDRLKQQLKEKAQSKILDNILLESQWALGFGRTVRRNGDVVIGSFRDIFDTGYLLSTLNFEWRGLSLWVTSDCPYIEAVLNGYTDKDKQIFPPRDFLDLDR